jgi:hypothetical protein
MRTCLKKIGVIKTTEDEIPRKSNNLNWYSNTCTVLQCAHDVLGWLALHDALLACSGL